MEQFKKKTLCYGVLAVLLMSWLSACGSLTMEGMSPLQGGLTLDRHEIAQPSSLGESLAASRPAVVQLATTGEFVGVVNRTGTRQGPNGYTESPPLHWDPSSAQIAASIAIGAVWYYFVVRQIPYDDM